jgi:hypothetical protein
MRPVAVGVADGAVAPPAVPALALPGLRVVAAMAPADPR